MKIRHGFVSNSSSSSFVLVGIQLNEEEWAPIEEQIDQGEFGGKLHPSHDLDFSYDNRMIGFIRYIEDEEYEVREFPTSVVEKTKERLEEYLGRPVTMGIFIGREGC